jgi:hypothetical protein
MFAARRVKCLDTQHAISSLASSTPMFTHAQSVTLRVVILLSALIALPPAMYVKGAEHDPLRHAAWWSHNLHSGVLAVGLATVAGAVIYFALARRTTWKWWRFSLAGICNAAMPALVYAVATPSADWAQVPLLDMAVSAVVFGSIGGLIVYALLRSHRSPESD